ncbi:MAG TPA: LacI family DNA-binding transcriptional regulator [Gaiellaceae bacterium]|nr:LacI family DNA-binding transcriptional regulator [Gaiellaceae bacterium]
MAARPTIRDVAQKAGVSIATVSRVLNDKGDVRSTTRDRVHEAASELGYSVDSVGRALASQRTRLVGVLVGDNAGHRDLSLMFFGKVLAAISRRLGQAGYEPLLLQDADAGGAHRFDAGILIGVDEDDPAVLDMAAHGVPLVGVDVRCGGAFVGSDHAGGVRLALAHLRALGHRRIAHIAGATNTLAGAERLEAFRGSCSDQPEEYVRFGDFSSASGYREASELLALDEPPTAIVCASDLMALAALQAIWESGRRPGRDVAVVGFDDLEAAALAHPPLTTIRQDRQELGATAAECAIDLLERPDGVARSVVLPVELVVRASSSPG